MAMICDHVEAEMLKTSIGGIQEDAVSVDDYVRKIGANDNTAKMANFWTQAFHGLESTQVPVGYFIHHWRNNHGLPSLAANGLTGSSHKCLQDGMWLAEGLCRNANNRYHRCNGIAL